MSDQSACPNKPYENWISDAARDCNSIVRTHLQKGAQTINQVEPYDHLNNKRDYQRALSKTTESHAIFNLENFDKKPK